MAITISFFRKKSKPVRLLITGTVPDRVHPEQLPFYRLHDIECLHPVCVKTTQKMDDHLWISSDMAFTRTSDVNVLTEVVIFFFIFMKGNC